MTVNVPFSKKLPYTLFCQGNTLYVPHIDDEGFVEFNYKAGNAVILFYTFKDFRRAYIVCEPKKKDTTELNILPGVSCPIKIIFTAKGKKVDHLKRSLFILTQNDKYEIFKFPLIFWYKLSALIKFSQAQRSDLELLYKMFTRKGKRK